MPRILAALVVLLAFNSRADARVQYLKGFMEKYPKVEVAAKAAKCAICHPAKKKDVRNEYGTALAKLIKKNEKAVDQIDKALEAVEKEKASGGKTFGEIISGGDLPNANPAAAELRKLVPFATGMKLADLDRIATKTTAPKPEDVKSKSLTWVLMTLSIEGDETEDELAEFRFPNGVPKPAELAGEMTRNVVGRGKLRVATGPVTLVQADRITKFTAEIDGAGASGIVEFEVPELYAGRVHYKAKNTNAGWQIDEFHMPARNIHIRMEKPGEWAFITAETADVDEKWVQLFNGKNLDGWIPKIRGYDVGENYGNTFRVEDGLLKVRYDPEAYEAYDFRFGHLFYEKPFSKYRLRVEYRFVGEQCPGGEGWAFRNSGVMVHGEMPDQMTKDQKFPSSIEVQLLGGDGKKDRPTSNLCTPGTHVVMDGKLFKPHCVNSKSKTYHGDQWVTAEIEVHGSEVIKHVIDGEVVIQYTQPQLDDSEHSKMLAEKRGGKLLDSGSISLQSESHPCDFRKVEILVLD